MAAALLLLAAGAMVLVRLGWGGQRGLAAAGWAAAIAALAGLTARDGAWGLAIGSVAGMAAALALVLYAGWRSPAKAVRAPREAPAVSIPRRAHDLIRRVAVFMLCVPVAFAATQWLAFGAQVLARSGGWAEANSAALLLFLQPLAWGIVMAIQLTRAGPAQMVTAPAVAAVLGTALWGIA